MTQQATASSDDVRRTIAMQKAKMTALEAQADAYQAAEDKRQADLDALDALEGKANVKAYSENVSQGVGGALKSDAALHPKRLMALSATVAKGLGIRTAQLDTIYAQYLSIRPQPPTDSSTIAPLTADVNAAQKAFESALAVFENRQAFAAALLAYLGAAADQATKLFGEVTQLLDAVEAPVAPKGSEVDPQHRALQLFEAKAKLGWLTRTPEKLIAKMTAEVGQKSPKPWAIPTDAALTLDGYGLSDPVATETGMIGLLGAVRGAYEQATDAVFATAQSLAASQQALAEALADEAYQEPSRIQHLFDPPTPKSPTTKSPTPAGEAEVDESVV